jgi:hypothetical protein
MQNRVLPASFARRAASSTSSIAISRSALSSVVSFHDDDCAQ